MKSLFAVIALFLVGCLGCASTQPATSPYNPRERDLAVTLTFPDGGLCSGTPVARNTILTAGHCVDKNQRALAVDGVPTMVREVILDGENNDHALVIVNLSFRDWARFGKLPQIGDRLHIYGNPGGLPDLYREGEFTAYLRDDGFTFYLFDMNIWHGDSGAALWNSRGEVVNTVTGYFYETNPITGAQWKIAIALPFAFTAAEWARAGIADPMPVETVFTRY